MTDCVFCKMVNGDIPVTPVYESETVLAFRDISPQAPEHMLVIPKRHIATLNELQEDDTRLMGELTQAARKIAQQLGLAEDGFRLVMNCNANAGQTVFHIHMHMLAGRPMTWPPG